MAFPFLPAIRNAVERIKAPVPAMRASDIVGTGPWSGWGSGWWPLIREPFAGAWQRNLEVRGESAMSNVTQFRCLSLISSDIAKLRLKLIHETAPGVWEEAHNPAWSPIIRKPNRYQTRIQFYENWMLSKLAAGNTYVLKERDERGIPVRFYILDPRRCRPLVADDGDVIYELYSDNLAGLGEQIRVPASEIIHDRWNCLFHPLVGMSPIWANALPTSQALKIQEHSTQFFANGANPGGILTGDHRIDPDTAERFRTEWQTKFTGPNVGRIAVLGGGLKFERLGVTALDSQLIEQLKWTAEAICASYGVPAYKAGAAPAPTLNNIEAQSQQYYQDCLQIHIEAIELLVDEGLSLPADWGVEFDLDQLLRMDQAALVKAVTEATGAGVLKIDEGRLRLGYGPIEGGDDAYLQQQNFSLRALAKRDAKEDPFATGGAGGEPAASTPQPPAAAPDADKMISTVFLGIEDDDEEQTAAFVAAFEAKFAGQLQHAA